MPILDDVTQAVGNTPLVRINRIIDAAPGVTVAAKLEFQNPGASVKDRIGVAMIDAAEASGELTAGDTIIVEGTSGQHRHRARHGLRRPRLQRRADHARDDEQGASRKLLRAYGAELVLTEGARGHEGRDREGEEIVAERRGRYVLAQQFENPPTRRSTAAPRPRRSGTTPTAPSTSWSPASAPVAPSPVSARCSRSASPACRSIAVEPEESPILNGGAPGPHKIQGIGANFVPEILDTAVYDEVIDVNAATAVQWARRAATEEGLLVGLSSGAALAAAAQVAARPENAGKTIVVIIPSFGERYLSTILFDGLVD
jgi:cysteine synthase A